MLVYGILFLYLALLAVFLRNFMREIVRLREESERRNSHLLALEQTLIVAIQKLRNLNRE